ncbi:MAG: outer membrane protein assembly factor BamB family protein [Promethearchaeota archaeon]|jgi:outer membrane protein assembly factor BamB
MKKNKTLATITLILLMIAAVSLTTGVNAQPPLTKQTFAYVGLIPGSVGVNQEVLIHVGIFSTSPGTGFGWEGLTVTVTKPDGTTQTLGPFRTDPTGGTGTSFTPTQVGTYTFQTHFPEQLVPIPYFDFNTNLFYGPGSTFLASDSEIVSLDVTEEPIQFYPDIPLPTEFWSRPIDQQFRGWSGISGNWLDPQVFLAFNGNYFVPHNDGPETAHILWTKPLTAGGLAGGATGEHGMEEGDAYEGKWPDAIIMNGILYYNRYGIPIFPPPLNPAAAVIAVDLRTGEELWVKDGVTFSFGQTFNFESHNYHGVFDYLWEVQGSTWNAYDPFTGDWSWTITDVPIFGPDTTGRRYTGSQGEIYVLVTDLTNNWMALWNQSSLSLQEAAKDFFDPVWAQGSWGRNVEGKVLNGSMAYSWNVTLPANLPLPSGGLITNLGPNRIEDRIVGIQLTDARDKLSMWGVSLKEGQEGQLIFNTQWTPPAAWQAGLNVIRFAGATDYGPGGVFMLWSKEERKYYGFSLDTGTYLWETDPEHYLNALSTFELQIAYDKAYSIGVAGILYCYDISTGETLWTYEIEDLYSEYLFGDNWWGDIHFITDGKLYIGHYEHSPVDPKPRGAPFVCLDAETGEVIWRIDGMFRQTEWGGEAIIGDSIIATMDTYDQRIYAIGKGPSQTTVEAPNVGVPLGSSIVISGSVTDIAAGTSAPTVVARFPNGVAAVSDESMSEWMKYVYKLFPIPADTVGVEVSLDVIDTNGNFRNIGTATSDINGFFYYPWMPNIPGEYKVIATFAGSEAYYPSYAEAAFVVDEAPEATPPPEATPAPMTDTYIAGSAIAIIAVVVIFGLLLLRKK